MAKTKEVLTPALTDHLQKALDGFVGAVKTETTLSEVYAAVIRATFETVLSEGQVVLPDGWGKLVVKKRVTSVVTAPDGSAVEVGPKPRLEYIKGKAVKAVLG
jgi:nucleoid DNA-binding protein